MRKMMIIAALTVAALAGGCTGLRHEEPRAARDDAPAARTATIGCATCIFKMEGVTGCKLAVKIAGTPYLVSGSGIDDHGDAHAADGLCNAERQAAVTGEVRDDRFVAQRIELLPKRE